MFKALVVEDTLPKDFWPSLLGDFTLTEVRHAAAPIPANPTIDDLNEMTRSGVLIFARANPEEEVHVTAHLIHAFETTRTEVYDRAYLDWWLRDTESPGITTSIAVNLRAKSRDCQIFLCSDHMFIQKESVQTLFMEENARRPSNESLGLMPMKLSLKEHLAKTIVGRRTANPHSGSKSDQKNTPDT